MITFFKIFPHIIVITIAIFSKLLPLQSQPYSDKRPVANLRMDAKDTGIVLKHGDGPGPTDNKIITF